MLGWVHVEAAESVDTGVFAVIRLRSSSTRTPAHRFYEGLGYVNVKTQYSFVKPLDADGAEMAARLVPPVDPVE